MKATYTISHENLEALNTRIEALENQCRSALDERDIAQARFKGLEDRLNKKLPCDVKVPPGTTINKGCEVYVLLECINRRNPKETYTFNKANQ